MPNRPTTIISGPQRKKTTYDRLKLEKIVTTIKPLYVIFGTRSERKTEWQIIATYTQRAHAELVLSYLEVGGTWDQHHQSFVRSTNEGT